MTHTNHCRWGGLVASRMFSTLSHGSDVDLSCSPVPPTRGTFLKQINRFDNVEFGIGDKDGTSLATVTQKLVELSFLAMQDAGIEYRGKKMGSFMCGTGSESRMPVSCQLSRHLIVPYVCSVRKWRRQPIGFHTCWVSTVHRSAWIRHAVPP